MLKDYLYEELLLEKEIVLNLIQIDNQVCHTKLTYEDILEMFKKDVNLEKIDTYKHFICDGDVYTVLELLINYAPYILNIYIDHMYLAINSWLIHKTCNYYNSLGINLNINLDDSINPLKYQQFDNVVISGDEGFIEGIKGDFKNNLKVVLFP